MSECIGCGGDCVDRCKDDPQFQPQVPPPGPAETRGTCIGCGGDCIGRCKDDPQFNDPTPGATTEERR